MNIYTSRRKIIWGNLNGFYRIFALVVATALGAGLFPIAPGTMGTLMGLPLAYWSYEWPVEWRLALWIGLTALGTWAAKVIDQTMQTKDNQNIVIDEVVGIGITSWMAGRDWKTWAAAFVIFRFFDVLKLPPVRQIDQWSKNQSSPIWEGFGVMADDIVAGFQGLILIFFLRGFHFLP